jgi:hypothetical protein
MISRGVPGVSKKSLALVSQHKRWSTPSLSCSYVKFGVKLSPAASRLANFSDFVILS